MYVISSSVSYLIFLEFGKFGFLDISQHNGGEYFHSIEIKVIKNLAKRI